MPPRPGGETDKLGNKFELAWAIRHALYRVLDDRRALAAEDVDAEAGRGSEFTCDIGLIIKAHQIRHQNGDSNGWIARELANKKIFEAAASYVAAGRRYRSVSLTPCRLLQELADRVRKSADPANSINCWLTGELSPVSDQLLAAELLGGPQAAWNTLRGMWFAVHDECDIIRANSMPVECNFSGANGYLISLAIGDILLDNLDKRMTRTELLDLLAERDIKPLEWGSYQTAYEQILAITSS